MIKKLNIHYHGFVSFSECSTVTNKTHQKYYFIANLWSKTTKKINAKIKYLLLTKNKQKTFQ